MEKQKESLKLYLDFIMFNNTYDFYKSLKNIAENIFLALIGITFILRLVTLSLHIQALDLCLAITMVVLCLSNIILIDLFSKAERKHWDKTEKKINEYIDSLDLGDEDNDRIEGDTKND